MLQFLMFRPPRPLPRPHLCCLSSCAPLGSGLSLIPTTLPTHTGTLLQRERLPLPPVTSHQSQITKSFTIRTYEKHASNPFRIRTSKTQDLKPFRMNTSEKNPGGMRHTVQADSAPSRSRHTSFCPPNLGVRVSNFSPIQLSTFDFQPSAVSSTPKEPSQRASRQRSGRRSSPPSTFNFRLSTVSGQLHPKGGYLTPTSQKC